MMSAAAHKLASRMFRCDGDFACSLSDMIDGNPEDPWLVVHLLALEVGETYRDGGGAQAEIVITRLPDDTDESIAADDAERAESARVVMWGQGGGELRGVILDGEVFSLYCEGARGMPVGKVVRVVPNKEDVSAKLVK